jgi:gliding motility-associated-like protein
VQFILHKGAGNQIQNEIARNDVPQFCFDPGAMQFNTQYFISAVAGPDDGFGNVLLSGACAQSAVGSPVMFREIPLASIDDPDQIDCDNPEIALTGNSSITSSSFAWSSRDGNILTDPTAATIRVNAGGYYELVVTSNTCKDTAGVEVEQSDDYPSLITGPVGTLNCRDSLVTLSGTTEQSDVELLWVTITNNDTTVIGSGESLIVNAPGTYYLLGIAANGCTSSKALTIDEQVNVPDVDAGEDITLSCDQSSLKIIAIASDDVEYVWTAPPGVSLPINNTSSVSIDQPGVYVVLVTDTLSFCTDTDSIEVFSSQDTPMSTIIADHVSCFGEANGSIIVQPEMGQGPFTFLMNGKDNGDINVFSSLAPGLFIIEVIDAGGCSWSTEVEITEPEPMVVDLGANLTVDPGESITLEVQTNLTSDQIESVVWTPEQGIQCLDEPCTSIRFDLFTSEEILVTVTDTNGCVGSDALSILVTDDRHFFAPNIFSPNSDGNNDAFTLFAGSGVRALRSLRIFDRWGELIFTRENFSPNDLSAGWDGTFRGKHLDPGVFLWQAEIEYQNGDAELRYGDVTMVR